MTLLLAWIAAGVAFVIVDSIWLMNAVPRLYKPMIGPILAEKLNFAAVVAFYIIYVSGIVLFAVRPALAEGGLTSAFLLGSALGLFAYATYDLTNQATLAGWDIRLTLIDMAWGTLATAIAAGAGYIVASHFG